MAAGGQPGSEPDLLGEGPGLAGATEGHQAAPGAATGAAPEAAGAAGAAARGGADQDARDVLVAALPGVVTALLLQSLEGLGALAKLGIAAALGLGLWWVLRSRARSRAARQHTPPPAGAEPAPPPPAGPVAAGHRKLTTAVLLLVGLAALSVIVLVVSALLFGRPTWPVVTIVVVGLVLLMIPAIRPTPVPSVLALPLAAAVTGATLGLGVATGVASARDEAAQQVPAGTTSTTITTFDGLRYPIRAVGDFWATRATDQDESLAVQLRLAVVDGPEGGAVQAVGVAASMGSAVVTFDGVPPAVRIGGTSADGSGPWEDDGVVLSRSGETWVATAPSGAELTVTASGDFLDWTLRLADSAGPTYEGLLGNNDQDSDNDLQVQGGDVIEPLIGPERDTLARIDGEFADSWRVPDSDQLLD